jgi:hypothetical protein
MSTIIQHVIQYTNLPPDGCGLAVWSPAEVRQVQMLIKPEIYMGWSFDEWRVQLIINRLRNALAEKG